jgi:hypothetical protein
MTHSYFSLFFQDIVITPNQVGLPLCKYCKRPVKGDLVRHERRCYWCETCQDFVTTDIDKHRCTIPGPKHFPCPICGRITEDSNYMRHLRNQHDDVDPELYRRRTESAKHRELRLKREGKVISFCYSFRPTSTYVQ